MGLTPAGKKPGCFNARNGQGDSAAEGFYAAQIAWANLGGLVVRRANYLTEFNAEYISFYRMQLVYRFDVDDGNGTRGCVSTMTVATAGIALMALLWVCLFLPDFWRIR